MSTTKLCLLAGLLFVTSAARLSGDVVTLWAYGNATADSFNSVTLTTQQVAEVRTLLISGPPPNGTDGCLRIASETNIMWIYRGWMTNGPVWVAGPATIRLYGVENGGTKYRAMSTLDIQPSAFPPDKAMTLGPYSGSVRVTMEMSTDLANWTSAYNGEVYTNSPDARFFRIRMDKNASR